MDTVVAITGAKEVDDALSYMRGPGVVRIGRACVRKMATVVARRIRPFIPRQLRPNSFGGGIGSRGIRGPGARAKAGIAVGRAGKTGTIVNRGVGAESFANSRIANVKGILTLKDRGKKFRRFIRHGHRGVGISAQNLHWFAGGTVERYTGSVKSGNRRKPTGNARKYTGRIDKSKFGGFVQRGAAAAQSEAVAEAVRLANRLIPEEIRKARAKGGNAGSGVLAEMGIDPA